MKTIQNEGMLLSDFGYYESEKSKASYHMASGIKDFDKGNKSTIGSLASMKSSLLGLGVSVQNISVEPTSAPGLWIVADVKENIRNKVKGADYSVNKGVQTLTSILF